MKEKSYPGIKQFIPIICQKCLRESLQKDKINSMILANRMVTDMIVYKNSGIKSNALIF